MGKRPLPPCSGGSGDGLREKGKPPLGGIRGKGGKHKGSCKYYYYASNNIYSKRACLRQVKGHGSAVEKAPDGEGISTVISGIN